jgi:hypothetical protein
MASVQVLLHAEQPIDTRQHRSRISWISKDRLVAMGQYIFETIEEAQDQATEWLWTYNNERPNMGMSGMTPAMKLKTAA